MQCVLVKTASGATGNESAHYYGQFALSLKKESPYIFSKLNPLNTETLYGPSVSVLTGFDCTFDKLRAHSTRHYFR